MSEQANAGARKKHRFSIGLKMYLFVTLTVFIVSISTAFIAYTINARQIDRYFKRLAENTATNYASLADGDFLARLRKIAETEEYAALRDHAEEIDDDTYLKEYFERQGIWEEYRKNQAHLSNYLSNMDDVDYLYFIVFRGKDATQDMYLMDEEALPVYQTGYYEDREPEFEGVETLDLPEPIITHGDWGWLCSSYAGVRDSEGNLVCYVGCDVSMEDVMAERYHYLVILLISAFLLTAVMVFGAILLANRIIIKPLRRITNEMNKFQPNEDVSYEEAGVMDLKLRSNDEIQDIHQAIRSMQIHIIDHLNALSAAEKDKQKYLSSLEQAENDIKDKEAKIGEISKEAYRDALTRVGNKAAYVRKAEELSQRIENGFTDFAIVMVDLNDVKLINDQYGHRAGDVYIKSACHLVCHCFKHSPVFRVGGDEFVVILEGEDYENRTALIDMIRKQFAESYANEAAQPQERLSAAVGIAEYASDDNTVELVFRRADSAMYEEKKRFKESHGSYR